MVRDAKAQARASGRQRGFESFAAVFSTEDSGGHAVARWRGLAVFTRALPRARGLALGYTLSPAGAGLQLARAYDWRGLAIARAPFQTSNEHGSSSSQS